MIRRILVPLIILGAGLALVACGDDEPSPAAGGAATQEAAHEEAGHAAGTYVANASAIAGSGAADWANAEVIRVELSEFAFTPNALTFEAGKPYKLEVVTTGAVKHEFTAHEFFPSVAWRKAESAESEVKVPYFTEVEVFAGKQVDLYFVPVTPGTYELVCEIEGHLEAGMRGTVTVTGSAPTNPAPEYAAIADGPWVQNGADLVSGANWDDREVINVDLAEFSFGPNEIHLQAGRPYVLNFSNIGGVKHEATAPEFFKTVAFRKVEDASGEFKGPAPVEVEVFSGAQTELFVIPTKPGTYELVCEIEGHLEAGMRGQIIVE